MPDNTKKTISLLIPAYNEGESINSLYDTLTTLINGDLSAKYAFEVLFVDDGSKDNTLALIKKLRDKDPRINYIDLSRNFGKENALLAGLDFVTGDCVILMDADLQHPVDVIPEMVRNWENGYDDVYGSRMNRGKEPVLRRVFTKTFYNILQSASRIEMLPNVGDFRLLDRKCINALRQLRETERYTKGLYCWIGFKKKEVKYAERDSIRAASTFNFFSLFNLAMQGITGFTTSPLRISAIVGAIVSMFALLYLVFIVIKTIFWGETIQGFPTIMCTMLFLGGIQLLAIGIIGEYVGKIYNETKNRPIYIVNTHNGSTPKS